MPLIAKLPVFMAVAVGLNIPFGSYRVLTKKFSVAWWLAIHLPIPFIILLRTVAFDLPLWVIPISLVSAVAGQVIGSRLELFGRPGSEAPAETVELAKVVSISKD